MLSKIILLPCCLVRYVSILSRQLRCLKCLHKYVKRIKHVFVDMFPWRSVKTVRTN